MSLVCDPRSTTPNWMLGKGSHWYVSLAETTEGVRTPAFSSRLSNNTATLCSSLTTCTLDVGGLHCSHSPKDLVIELLEETCRKSPSALDLRARFWHIHSMAMESRQQVVVMTAFRAKGYCTRHWGYNIKLGRFWFYSLTGTRNTEWAIFSVMTLEWEVQSGIRGCL